jgi:hypothetical protein
MPPCYLTTSRLLILISAFLAVSAKTLYHQLDSYSFEDYVKEFNLSFSESELPTRRALFNSETLVFKPITQRICHGRKVLLSSLP